MLELLVLGRVSTSKIWQKLAGKCWIFLVESSQDDGFWEETVAGKTIKVSHIFEFVNSRAGGQTLKEELYQN